MVLPLKMLVSMVKPEALFRLGVKRIATICIGICLLLIRDIFGKYYGQMNECNIMVTNVSEFSSCCRTFLFVIPAQMHICILYQMSCKPHCRTFQLIICIFVWNTLFF